MSTDIEWEKWALQDPYFSVLTAPRFRMSEMTAEARQEFFFSGRVHAEHVLQACRNYLDGTFTPKRVLDFGCGVGRVLIPFAELAQEAVGMDVAPSMLAEARKNCAEKNVNNVSLVLSDDALSAIDTQFDLVHSCIVLQHIPVERGRAIFAKLVDKIQPGGCGAIHLTFGWDVYAASHGVPPAATSAPKPAAGAWAQIKASARQLLIALHLQPKFVAGSASAESPVQPDPEMQMNFYNFSELMFIMQRAGVQRYHAEFTDHGGALGAFLFLQKPA